MTTDRARIFFALWPDAPVRAALSKAAIDAQIECAGRATASEKIHLTLFFIGEVERSRVPRLADCARPVTAPPFTLDLRVLGYWRHSRIVWAGADAGPVELSALVSTLTRNLKAEGIEAEDRPYVPHVTLVRNARRAPSRKTLDAPLWRAHELVLVESAPAQRGSRYEIIERFPLSG